MDLRKDKIRAEALRLGFSFIGFSKPCQTPHFQAYESWVKELQQKELEYLKKKYVIEARNEPKAILENVRTVIVVGKAYSKPVLPITANISEYHKFGQIAAYACLPDYHRWFKDRSRELIKFMNGLGYSSGKIKFFVDSGPVMEKDFAFQAGLGWIGKNSLFISPRFGSLCLLGCLFVDFDLKADVPDETDLCGECDLCIRSCPTQAISNKRTVAVSRCISFLTTNTKGDIPLDLCMKVGDHVFGCDICQSVCPLNRDIPDIKISQSDILAPIINEKIDLLPEMFISERSYFEKYSPTPIGKLPHEVFLRNLIIAAGNSGEGTLIGPLKDLIRIHPSFVVQNAANWAISAIDRTK